MRIVRWRLPKRQTTGFFILPCIHRPLAALLIVATLAVGATAGPFTGLVVFGDSLSDVGNVAQATDAIPSWIYPTTPGEYYYNGRFSNGPVYAELLAERLDLPPLTHSRAGGNNFAHGGAMTTGSGFWESFVIEDVDDQVSDYLNSRTTDPDNLFIVFAGGNDLINGQTTMSDPVNRLFTDLGRLIADGARHFLVPNLPLLGETPYYNTDPTNRATYNARSQQFNTALATMLDTLETTYPAIEVARLDVAQLFTEMIAAPSAYGLTNVTAPAAPGLEPGDDSYNTNQIAANPDEYLFWDELHPTAAVHEIFADRAFELFALPGDFNGDWKVDAADYVAWRANLDGTATPAGYNAWRSSFGFSSNAGTPAAGTSQQFATIPEPSTLLLSLGFIVLCSANRPVRR